MNLCRLYVQYMVYSGDCCYIGCSRVVLDLKSVHTSLCVFLNASGLEISRESHGGNESNRREGDCKRLPKT